MHFKQVCVADLRHKGLGIVPSHHSFPERSLWAAVQKSRAILGETNNRKFVSLRLDYCTPCGVQWAVDKFKQLAIKGYLLVAGNKRENYGTIMHRSRAR